MTEYISLYMDGPQLAQELINNKDLLIEVLNEIGYHASQDDNYLNSLARAIANHDDPRETTEFIYYLNKTIRDGDYDD